MTLNLPTGRPALMGIVNVTPDSFSDGGLHFAAKDAIDAGLRMSDEGADVIDVGGESTRPGADEVGVEEELQRVIPVVEALAAHGLVVSIDTMKPAVAEAALRAGAKIVNDVTAFSDPKMAEVAARFQATVCLMHMRGTPRTMQANPSYTDVVQEVRDYLLERAAFAESEGILRERIWIDPGFGFGKTVRHNLQLIGRLEEFVSTGYPVLIGVSRKSTLGKVLGGDGDPVPVDQRREASIAAQVVAQMKGARMIRTHDVKEARRAIDVVSAIFASCLALD